MKLILRILLVCLVVVVTMDGVHVAYDESADSVIAVTVNGVDSALQSSISGQLIIISVKASFDILRDYFIILRNVLNTV